MYFMKYDVFVKGEGEKFEKDVRRKDAAKVIAIRTRDYNSDHPDSWFFVRDMGDDSVSVGAIFKNEKKDRELSGFAKAIGIDAESVFAEEVSFSKMLDMLHRSYRGNYIEDDDDFTVHFELEHTKKMLDSLFGENVFENAPKRTVMRRAVNHIHSDSLAEELNRIYSCKKSKNSYGHPVHYVIETDDRNWRRETLQTLLQALNERGRVPSRRYCFMNINSDTNCSENEIDAVYKMNKSGTVVVRFEMNSHGGGDIVTAFPGEGVVETVCRVVKNHRNDVLTVFELPGECSSYKATLSEYMADMTFVEIKETLFSGENAREFLKKCAKEAKMIPDDALFGAIDDGAGYYAYELKKVFDAWYGKNLKTTVFPAYQSLVSDVRNEKAFQPKGTSFDELNAMIGLKNAKKAIGRIIDYFKARKIFGEQGTAEDRPSMNMIFTGNPGTAKTSVARLFAGIMKENGLVLKGNIIEVGRADLVGRYVGWTAQIVRDKFKEAVGGVLFIDEAYSLATENGGSYGQEAIDTIVREMENHRRDVVTIFAGYPEKMEHFLETNPGLRSRITFRVHFDDYSADELCGIARLIAKKKGFDVDEKACEKLKDHLEIARTRSDFGNGRYARNLIENAVMTQASRLIAKGVDTVTKTDLRTITAEDIVFPDEYEAETKRKIGFS